MNNLRFLKYLMVSALFFAGSSPGKGFETPIYQHLLDQARDRLTERDRHVAWLVDPASLETRRDWVRQTLIDSFGGFPEKTPLNGRTVWTKDFDGYKIEGVLYESQPGLYVTANLYIPTEGNGPFPAVLGPCGHSNVGKAADAYQSAWINLAKRGFVVLSFDPVGQGERMAYLTEEGKARFGPTTEHTMLGVQALLIGGNIAREFIWDGIRSIDYLLTRPEVDPDRIGCTGNSGGGTQTAYFMCIDRRIQAAAPSCYITSLERLYSTIGPQDAEQNFVGQAALGIDHADYVEACIPRPVLICAASDDFFDIDGTWKTFREAKNFFQRYGIPERVDIIEAPDTHGFSKPRRTRAYHWMERWLKGGSDYTPEPETELQPPENLLCTESGQVALSIEGARSLCDIYRDEALALKRERKEENLDLASLQEELRKTLRLEKSPDSLEWKRKEAKPEAGMVTTHLTVEIEPGWELETRLDRPQSDPSDSVVLWLEDALYESEGLSNLIEKGFPVLSYAPRGLSNKDRLSGNSLYEHFGNFPLYFLALHLDRPLAGQRVLDILACVDFLEREFPGKKIEIFSEGRAVPPALLSAALDERITEVHGEGGLVSWESIFDSSHSVDCLSNVAPGILKVADIPELVEAIQPRKVFLKDAISPTGETLKNDEMLTLFQDVLGKGSSTPGNLSLDAGE
ncbi:MAG: acetylxylan esterase [Candidatus Omnitrophica bacterium]|nr:acetylxylan esterase [Candidatus Omnitrophota bacterium]